MNSTTMTVGITLASVAGLRAASDKAREVADTYADTSATHAAQWYAIAAAFHRAANDLAEPPRPLRRSDIMGH